MDFWIIVSATASAFAALLTFAEFFQMAKGQKAKKFEKGV
jgi:hypothetical protein